MLTLTSRATFCAAAFCVAVAALAVSIDVVRAAATPHSNSRLLRDVKKNGGGAGAFKNSPLGRDHRVNARGEKLIRTREQTINRINKRFGPRRDKRTQQPQQKQGDNDYGHNVPIDGDIWPVSVFWTTVSVGTPPVSYAVALDSGSNALFLEGASCANCQKKAPNRPYVAAASRTSLPLLTNFSYTYETCTPWNPTEQCTITGKYYTDMVSLADYEPFVPIKLGSIETQSADFYQFSTVGGIMGMTAPPFSGRQQSLDIHTVFQQQCEVHSALTGCASVYAVCMSPGELGNGTLTVGGIDPRLTSDPGNMERYWVPQVAPQFGYCSNHLFGLQVGNLSVPNFQVVEAVLDTGTNDLLLKQDLFMQVQQLMCGNKSLAHCDRFFSDPKFCATLTDAEIDAYPDLTLQLANGVTLKITSRDYLLLNSPIAGSSSKSRCFAIGSGGDNWNIIGDTIMQNYYLAFDYRNGNARNGWFPVNRNMCGSV